MPVLSCIPLHGISSVCVPGQLPRLLEGQGDHLESAFPDEFLRLESRHGGEAAHPTMAQSPGFPARPSSCLSFLTESCNQEFLAKTESPIPCFI